MTETHEFLNEILAGDRTILDEVEKSLDTIGEAAEAIANRLAQGGRWFYVGAGTSGRLGVLDAAELPPTFGVGSDRIMAVIAGGDKTIRKSSEGAEDSPEAGAKDLKKAGVKKGDAVLAIAASGTTPYTVGALNHAREKEALTVALVCNPGTPLTEAADVAISIHTGPELLSGSTRMKAATAQKIVLTMLSTTVMKILGRIYEGEMVAMQPANNKLRARAVRIVRDLLTIESDEAKTLLESSDWDLPVSLVRGRFGLSVKDARAKLEEFGGSIAATLEVAESELGRLVDEEDDEEEDD